MTATPDSGEVPVFSECVIGYRCWSIDALGRLRAVNAGTAWEPGVNTAKCVEPPRMFFFSMTLPGPHPSPSSDCSCGLYAWRELPALEPWLPKYEEGFTVAVLGAAAMWGDLEVHETGFRAEHACVVALGWYPGMSTRVLQLLARVADEYRADLVPASELEDAALRHGRPLPADLKPPAPPPPPTLELNITLQTVSKDMLEAFRSLRRASRMMVLPPPARIRPLTPAARAAGAAAARAARAERRPRRNSITQRELLASLPHPRPPPDEEVPIE